MGNFLGSLAQTAVGFAPYALKAVRENEDRNLQQAAQKIAQDRQAKQDALAQAMGASTMAHNAANSAHLDAETDVLKQPKSDIKSTVFDQDGNPWNEHTDGTLSRASIRGQAPTAPVPPTLSPTDHPGDIDLREPQAVAQGQPQAPQAPQAPQPPAPKFGTRAPREPNPATIPGTPEWAAARKQGAEIDAKYGYHPPILPQVVSAVDPATQQPKFFRIPKEGGDAQEIGGITPKPAATGAGQNAPQMAAAKANLASARQIMDDFEAKLKTGKARYGVLDATAGALASSPVALNAKGILGGLESFGSNLAGSHLQSANPELAQYMAAKKYVAEAILNTHKRPNQTQYEIEQELSGAGANPSTQQIDMGKARRDRMWDEVFNNPNAGGAVAPAPRSAGAPAAHDALLSKYGIKPTVP